MARVNPEEARHQLKKVKGHLVLLPLQFLAAENLSPAAGTKEALAPTVIWT
jgi:phospholipase D1/2